VFWTHIGRQLFAQCPVITNVSIICPCQLDVLQILCYHVAPGLLGPPCPLLPLFGNHVSAWRGIRLLSIRCTCPSHCSLPDDDFHPGSPPYLVVSDFLSMWLPVSYVATGDVHSAASNCFIFTTVMVHDSARYRSADRTSASYNCIMVFMPSLLFFQIFSSLPNTEFVFPTLVIISFSLPPSQLQHFPSSRNFPPPQSFFLFL